MVLIILPETAAKSSWLTPTFFLKQAMFCLALIKVMYSSQLRRLKLQLEALPLDWGGGVTLMLAVNFIENHFEDSSAEKEFEMSDNCSLRIYSFKNDSPSF